MRWYNDFGQATSISIGAGGTNPLTETYSFDSQTGLMTNQKVKRGATSLMDLSYEYNRGLSKGSINGTTGQLTHIIDNLDRNKDRVYEFDTLGRLNKAKGGAATGASATANWTQDYTFDRYGNKQATTNTGYTANYQAIPLDGLPSQTFDTTSNRINEAGYEYDKAGNLIRGKAPDGSWQRFEYDSAGRLVKIKADNGTLLEEYTYGASRERLRKEANNQRTYYAWGGSSVLMEYFETTTALTWAKSYIYAGSRLLSTITNTAGSEVTEYHHPDRLGTRLITNPVGATQVEQNTLPFGTSINAETTGTSNQRFTSYDRSGTTGLDYAVNRTYNPALTKFIQVDPIGMAAASITDPQSMNLYAYVQNNPIDFIDPSGLNMSSASFVCYDIVTTGHFTNEPDTTYVNTRTVCHFFGGGSKGGGGGRQEPGGRNEEPGGGSRDPGIQDEPDPKEVERIKNSCLTIMKYIPKEIFDAINKNNVYGKSLRQKILALAHSAVESSHDPKARGANGEVGLFQLKPATANDLGMGTFTEAQLEDPEINTKLGTTHLLNLINSFGKNVRTALGAYKQGETGVREKGLSKRSQEYADGILACVNSLLGRN